MNKPNDKHRLTSEQKFWLAFWCIVMGSCSITSFADPQKSFVNIVRECGQ